MPNRKRVLVAAVGTAATLNTARNMTRMIRVVRAENTVWIAGHPVEREPFEDVLVANQTIRHTGEPPHAVRRSWPPRARLNWARNSLLAMPWRRVSAPGGTTISGCMILSDALPESTAGIRA